MISRIIGTGAVALGFLAGSSDAALCRLQTLSYSTQSSVLGIETTVLSSATIPEISSAVSTSSSLALPDTTSIVGTETSVTLSDSSSLSTSLSDTSDTIISTTISEIASETEIPLQATSTSEAVTSEAVTSVIVSSEAVTSEAVTSSIAPDINTTAQAQSTTTSAAATSYLFNTGFDITPGPVPSLQQWSLDPNSQTIDSSFYRDGPASLKITNIYGLNVGLGISQVIGQKGLLQPDTDYTFSVWVYPTSVGTSLSCVSVGLRCFIGGKPDRIGALTYIVPLSGADKWQEVSTTCRFTAAQLAEPQVGVDIDFEMGAHANSNSWLDTAFFGLA